MDFLKKIQLHIMYDKVYFLKLTLNIRLKWTKKWRDGWSLNHSDINQKKVAVGILISDKVNSGALNIIKDRGTFYDDKEVNSPRRQNNP